MEYYNPYMNFLKKYKTKNKKSLQCNETLTHNPTGLSSNHAFCNLQFQSLVMMDGDRKQRKINWTGWNAEKEKNFWRLFPPTVQIQQVFSSLVKLSCNYLLWNTGEQTAAQLQ